jgi:hypothetical protein
MARDEQRSFRDKAAAFFLRALGEPTRISVESGTIYRWVIPRKGGHDVNVYITLDSPELPDYAHIMISDPAAKDDQPVKSLMMRREEEFDRVLAEIRRHTG